MTAALDIKDAIATSEVRHASIRYTYISSVDLSMYSTEYKLPPCLNINIECNNEEYYLHVYPILPPRGSIAHTRLFYYIIDKFILHGYIALSDYKIEELGVIADAVICRIRQPPEYIIEIKVSYSDIVLKDIIKKL